MVPACRTLDCVSIFALTTDDAWTALGAIAGLDAPILTRATRPLGAIPAFCQPACGSACRSRASAMFFGDRACERAYDAAIDAQRARRADRRDRHRAVLRDGAFALRGSLGGRALHRRAQSLLASDPDAIHPVTREIIVLGASRPTAVDAFAAFYRLEELRRGARSVFRKIDALLLPTAPTVYTVKQVLADPIQLNSRLGTYTNFVNLLDLCGLAVPASMRRTACHSASHCWRRAGTTRCLPRSVAYFMPTAACRSARWNVAQTAARGIAIAGRPTKSRSPWSVRICPACHSMASCRALGGPFARSDNNRARLPALCP